jgi:hypothetical protein
MSAEDDELKRELDQIEAERIESESAERAEFDNPSIESVMRKRLRLIGYQFDEIFLQEGRWKFRTAAGGVTRIGSVLELLQIHRELVAAGG